MLHNFFLNICSILIQPQNYRIPQLIYQICIVLYFLQAFSNLLHLHFDSNWLLTIMATISKSTTLIHFVEDQNSEFLYWILYILLHVVLYSFFFCVILLPNHSINKIGKFFQSFIVFFPLILQDIYVEFNLVLIIEIGWHTLIGIIGLVSTAFMGVMSCYFSQPYEFVHNDLLRRKMSLIILCINLKLSIILVSSYEVDVVATIALYQIFSILSLIDALYLHPFPNIQTAKTYIWCAGLFVGLGIQAALYIYQVLSPDNIVVIMIGLSPLISYTCLTLYERQEFYYLQNLLIEDFWIFSQMLMDQKNNFKIYIALRSHINSCQTTYCYCQKYWEANIIVNNNIANSRNINMQVNRRVIMELNLNSQDIICLMDSMFQKALINCNQLLIEFYYISFLEKFQNNHLLGYFCLKRMSQHQKRYSKFYQIIFEVMSKVKVYHNQKLEEKLLNSIKSQQKQVQAEQQILNVEEIIKITKFIHKCKQCLLNILTQKLIIWGLLQKGNDSIDCLIKNLLRPLNRFLNSKNQMDQLIGSLEQNQQNCAFLKLQLISKLIISNSSIQQINKRIIELKQKDQYRDDLELNNFNFLQGQTIIIRAGIAQIQGKILNREKDKIATFFGYNASEMQQIQSINDLMPKHVAIVHNYILFQYLHRGTSPLLYTTRQIFLTNKDQFLISIAITLRHDFTDMNDCVYNASLLKLVQKELIMFDINGQIIGMSNELFQILSKDSTYFKYEELLRSGYIQIFMPKIVNIMKDLGEDTLHSNLQCSISSNEFSLKQCHNYMTQNTGTTHLLTNKSVQCSMQFINKQDIQISNINYKLKFELHFSKRDFKNIDLGILNIIGKQIPQGASLQYFVIEITEMEAHNKRYLSATNTSKLTSGITSIEQGKDLEVLDEECTPIHYNYEKLIVSPRFQIDSPRMNLETPKDTERGLILDHQDKGFLGKFFQRFQINRQGLENNPKYISKNAMQEEGIPESLNDVDISPKKDIQSQIKQKQKQKQKNKNLATKELLSHPSSNSKVNCNNLEELQYMTMPKPYKMFYRLKGLYLLFFVASVVTQILISQSGLAQIAEISQDLIIPYYFNLNYINYCQSAIYNSIQPETKFQKVMNDSIQKQFFLLYQEAYSYISYQNQKIVTQIYSNASDYQNIRQGLYEFQVTTQTLYIENSNLSLFNLLGRFQGNLNFTDYISDIQISKIQDLTNLIIQYSQLLAFIFMGIFFLPIIPTIQSINKINHFLEKIVLLVARVTLDESLKEMMRLNLLTDYIQQTQGLDLITKEIPNLERAQQINQKVKVQYLQSKIYNQRLSSAFYVGSILIEIILCIIFLIGALLYLYQIPDQFMQNAEQFIEQSHQYQSLQQRNLVVEMIRNNLTIQEKSKFIQNQDYILKIYDSLSIPLTNSTSDFFKQINFNNLCGNQSCEYAEYYEKGLSNVLSQIKILFSNNDGKYDSQAYEALIVNFPSFISPFITDIQESLRNILYSDIIQLSSGFLYYLIFGGLALLIMVSVWVYLVIQCKYN